MIPSKRKISILMARQLLDPADLEKLAGMPRVTLNKVLAGKRVRPKTLGKVANALGVDVEEIMKTD